MKNRRSICGLRDPSVWKHMWVSEMPMLTEESWSTRLRRPLPAIFFPDSILFYPTKFCNSYVPWTLRPPVCPAESGVYGETAFCICHVNCDHSQLLKKLKRFRFLSLLLFYWCTHDIGLVTISMCSFLWPINTLAHRVRNYRCDQRHWIARIP